MCHHLGEARVGVVDLVAVGVDQEAALLRLVEDQLEAGDARLPRRFVVRDAADHVRSHVEGAEEEFRATGVGVDTILGKGDDLQVDPVAHLVLDLQQGLHRELVLVRGVGVGADEACPLGDLPIDRLLGPGLHRFESADLLLPAPDGDSLVQRAGDVGLQVRSEHRVEMDVRVDQRARDEPARAVDHLAGLGRDPRLDGHNALALDGDVGRAHGLVLVRHQRILQNDVHTRLPPLRTQRPRQVAFARIFAECARNRQPGAGDRDLPALNRPLAPEPPAASGGGGRW